MLIDFCKFSEASEYLHYGKDILHYFFDKTSCQKAHTTVICIYEFGIVLKSLTT